MDKANVNHLVPGRSNEICDTDHDPEQKENPQESSLLSILPPSSSIFSTWVMACFSRGASCSSLCWFMKRRMFSFPFWKAASVLLREKIRGDGWRGGDTLGSAAFTCLRKTTSSNGQISGQILFFLLFSWWGFFLFCFSLTHWCGWQALIIFLSHIRVTFLFLNPSVMALSGWSFWIT